MSFLFRSSKTRQGPPTTLPPAAREIRSSDGPAPPAYSQAPNGWTNAPKPSSPTPLSAGHGGSLAAIAGHDRGGNTAPAEDRPVLPRDEATAPRIVELPEQKSLRDPPRDGTPQRMAMQPRTSQSDSSPFPWSQCRLALTLPHATPFPRYGAAVNSSASREGSIFIMGGLVDSSTIKSDLWLIEATAGHMTCQPVATTNEGPSLRVGHASLLVGNAFIVFGGDTNVNEGDPLDDTLYLLNTSSKQWSRAIPPGQRPRGRYGHTLNLLGSKIYVFGGQVEGFFLNDLVAFDLNTLQNPTNRWEMLIHNTIDGGPPPGQVPPPRTNHTMITWNDRLYLFGGTDGNIWYNDVWAYSPATNSWTQLDCVGYTPSPREGHAAALVGDVMYIFGGRNSEGKDLGDLAAFRLSTRRWYTFQNMGPSPSPRSGHSLTTLGKLIVVLGGEPSNGPRDSIELSMAYVLDTAKIRYPQDAPADRSQQTRFPSGTNAASTPAGATRTGQQAAELMDNEQQTPSDSMGDPRRMDPATRQPSMANQMALAPSPGPAPHGMMQKVNGMVPVRQPTRALDQMASPVDEAERYRAAPRGNFIQGLNSPVLATTPGSRNAPHPVWASGARSPDNACPDGRPPQTASHRSNNLSEDVTQQPVGQRRQMDGGQADTHHPSTSISKPCQTPDEAPASQDASSNPLSASNQTHADMSKEMDQLRRKNAWYASELALAQKSGYQSRSTDSPAFGENTGALGDDGKVLVEALIRMRAEVAQLQQKIDEQSRSTAERLAKVEKQRDSALHEAVLAKAKLAGQSTPSEGARGLPHEEHQQELSRKLASTLSAYSELSRKAEMLSSELESERQHRQLAEETAEAAQKRVTELDEFRQQHSSELDDLRARLHEAQSQHRDISVGHSELTGQHQMLQVERRELSSKLEAALSDSKNHAAALQSLKNALVASSEKADLFEQKYEAERKEREEVEEKLRVLRSEHETRSSEVESATRRLRDAEELAQKHAQEATLHREALLAGIDKNTDRGIDDSASAAHNERLQVLQQQVEAANELVQQNQAAANAAADKLRRAEERIATLEAHHEQASREGLSTRNQLQSLLKQNRDLAAEKADMEQKLQSHVFNANALQVQHATLKNVLVERGIDPSEARGAKTMELSTDQQRMKDLEQQLEASMRSHEETKAQLEDASGRDAIMRKEYEQKLTALDNDHQAAVKYLRGTEKMLSRMKQELQRVKNENGELKQKLEGSRGLGPDDGSMQREGLDQSHAQLRQVVSQMESQLTAMQGQLSSTETQLEQSRKAYTTCQADLSNLQATHSQARNDMERLHHENAMLEERARDAENKIQLLLDQFEHSVDNYRRQSRMAPGDINGTGHHMHMPSQTSGYGSQPGVHQRNISDAADSSYSEVPASAGMSENRNSVALDSLASELDAMRSHWELNRNYRMSDSSRLHENERMPATGSGTLADWRRNLALSDGSRPGTSEGSTVVGEQQSHSQQPAETMSMRMPGGMI